MKKMILTMVFLSAVGFGVNSWGAAESVGRFKIKVITTLASNTVSFEGLQGPDRTVGEFCLAVCEFLGFECGCYIDSKKVVHDKTSSMLLSDSGFTKEQFMCFVPRNFSSIAVFNVIFPKKNPTEPVE